MEPRLPSSASRARPKRDSEGKILKEDNGRRVEDTEWHRVTCFNGIGKSVADNVEKGQKVMVRGRIRYTRWTDQEDIERFGVEIIADEVTFLCYGKSRQQQNAVSQDNDDNAPL